MMTTLGFDVDSLNKSGLSFAAAYAQGYRACYIKLGGNNMSGNEPYMMNGYHAQVDAAFAAGFTQVGSYWMVGGHDPAGAGRFYKANRDPRCTFDVIDNENIDYGNLWSSAECGVFLDVIRSPDPWHYANKSTGGWGSQRSWPELVSRNVKGLVAFYNGSPFTNVGVNYPASMIKGHQFTSSASIGGLGSVDADAFTDDAFAAASPVATVTEDDMALICAKDQPGAPVYIFAPGFVKHLADPSQLQAAIWSTRLGQPDRFDNNDFQRTIWNYGLDEYTFEQVIGLSHGTNPDGTPNTNGGGKLWASALTSGGNVVPEIDYEKLASLIKVPQAYQIDSIPGKAVAA